MEPVFFFILGWLGDRAPPLIAGFIGGMVGELVATQLRSWWSKHWH